MKRVIRLTIAIGFWTFIFHSACFGSGEKPSLFLQEIKEALKRGEYSQAIQIGEKSPLKKEWKQETANRIQTHILLSRANQGLGFYKRALKELESAFELSKEKNLSSQVRNLKAELGNLYIFLNRFEEAETILKEALEAKGESETITSISMTILNTLGTLYSINSEPDKALTAFQESYEKAKQNNNISMMARVSANLARSLLQNGELIKADKILEISYKTHLKLENSRTKAYGLLNISQSFLKISDQENKAIEILKEALTTALDLHDQLAASYAYGYLGARYEEKGFVDKAREYTKQAIFLAQKQHAPEVLYQWQWQNGRLLKREKKNNEAIKSFRRAVQTFQSVRQELVSDCHTGTRISYKKSIEPLCFGLADLLLKQSETLTDEKKIQEKYKEYFLF